MTEWQPIETAPNVRGKHFLLFGDGANFRECTIVGYWWDITSKREGWVAVTSSGRIEVMPTHWMPLPEPPK